MTRDTPFHRTRCLFSACVLALVVGACSEKPAPEADGAFQGISTAAPTGSSAISTEGLVAAFDMETETWDGRLQDFSGNDHHGSLEDHRVMEGAYGQAKHFHDVTDRMHLAEDPAFDLDGPLSIAVWVRVDELNLHQHIVACDDKWALWITPANQYRLGDTRGGGWSTTIGRVQQGQWASVVTILGGTAGDSLRAGVIDIYIDGDRTEASSHLRSAQARVAGAWSPGSLYPEDACYVGFESHQGNAAHAQMPFVGAIDELLLFSRALTEDEVRAFAGR